MSNKETLNFTYESIGNIVRLLVTLQFENSNTPRDITIFHERFDKENDSVFEDFLTRLYPEGCTLGNSEILQLTEYILDYMDKDPECKNLYVEYDKNRYSSYVYFKIDNVVHRATFGRHYEIVRDICRDYFKDFDIHDLKVEYLEKFIKDNFEIMSNNTTIEKIILDADYIIRDIILYRNGEYYE